MKYFFLLSFLFLTSCANLNQKTACFNTTRTVASSKFSTCKHVFLSVNLPATKVKNANLLELFKLTKDSVKDKVILELNPGSSDFISYLIDSMGASKKSMSIDYHPSPSPNQLHLEGNIKKITLKTIRDFYKDPDFKGFDLIISSGWLGYMTLGLFDLIAGKILKNAYSLLSKNGQIIFSVPSYSKGVAFRTLETMKSKKEIKDFYSYDSPTSVDRSDSYSVLFSKIMTEYTFIIKK